MNVLPDLFNCSGQPIPKVEYCAQDIATWSVVYKQIKQLMPKTCRQYQEVFALLEKEDLYGEEKIPQLEDLSNFFKRNFLLFCST